MPRWEDFRAVQVTYTCACPGLVFEIIRKGEGYKTQVCVQCCHPDFEMFSFSDCCFWVGGIPSGVLITPMPACKEPQCQHGFSMEMPVPQRQLCTWWDWPSQLPDQWFHGMVRLRNASVERVHPAKEQSFRGRRFLCAWDLTPDVPAFPVFT